MAQIGWIRRLKDRKSKSEREIARVTGLSRNKVVEWLRADVQPPKQRQPGIGLQCVSSRLSWSN